MEGQQPASRPQLRRKLRDLIGHPGTEPFIRAEAQRKYALLFPHDDPAEPLPGDTEAFLIIERYLYSFPERLWLHPFLRVGAGFRQRTVTYDDVLRAAAGAELVGFYQIGRAVLVQYAKLVSPETLAARFAAHRLDCTVRHVDGFISNCRYQVRFPEPKAAPGRTW